MPATIRSEFALALNQVATERGIDPNIVLESIKAAILAAYRKDYGTSDLDKLEVTLNPDTGEAKVNKEGKDVTPPGFGRIAAQTAKQVILQKIREAEKKSIISDFTTKIGTVASGMVLRFDGPNIIVDIGRAEAVMPREHQVPQEHYRLNQRLTFYIEGIRTLTKGEEVIVSRSHPGLVLGLFKREVPEVANSAVTIKEIAREAGNRTKIAVYSNQSGVDPVGSCVGQKGIRVQAVINELGGTEKVDIIQWNDNPKIFIQSSLAPAKDIEITLDMEKKIATALVAEGELSQAIGREGQNVRLASKLSGWKIDIRPKTTTPPPQAAAASDDSTKTSLTTSTPTDDTTKTTDLKKDEPEVKEDKKES
ncbi:transcription termination factor NusA [Candidatus Gottesmanbacteria bacterium RIFCSPHIGHO2_02_FULL_39_11]|uniref:Transcription termination/antitermination protein NusA n=1 Tax=Candidatus Gottesmanbacteria bacterium RIFCSPHIGHO2_02_FULL_39_11 TaxID=1798382 RepID=A0A1F5ZWU0_9BACT|nr:MAG: transcription termination factor NusA [Candidatus Gottesmanbacteria bacterium RIFCSPHIGHO2_02_FULL_39_11]